MDTGIQNNAALSKDYDAVQMMKTQSLKWNMTKEWFYMTKSAKCWKMQTKNGLIWPNQQSVERCKQRMVLYDQISKVLKDANKEWFYMTKVLKDANKTGLVIVVYIEVECLKNVESKCTILILVVGSVRYGLCESVRSLV